MYVLNDYLRTTLRRFLRTETTNEVVTTPYCLASIYMPYLYLFMPRERDYVKHVLLAKYFTSIRVCKRVKGGKKSRIPLFFSISLSLIPLLFL